MANEADGAEADGLDDLRIPLRSVVNLLRAVVVLSIFWIAFPCSQFVAAFELGRFATIAALVAAWAVGGIAVRPLLGLIDRIEADLAERDVSVRALAAKNLWRTTAAVSVALLLGYHFWPDPRNFMSPARREAAEESAIRRGADDKLVELLRNAPGSYAPSLLYDCERPSDPCAHELSKVVFAAYYTTALERGMPAGQALEIALRLGDMHLAEHFEFQKKNARFHAESERTSAQFDAELAAKRAEDAVAVAAAAQRAAADAAARAANAAAKVDAIHAEEAEADSR